MSLGLTMKKTLLSLLVFVLLFSSTGGIASASFNSNGGKAGKISNTNIGNKLVNTEDERIEKVYIDDQVVTYTTVENEKFHSIKIEENYGVTSIVTDKTTNEIDVISTFLDADTIQEMEEEIKEMMYVEPDSSDVSTFAWTNWGPKFNGSTELKNRTYAVILAMIAAALGNVPVLAVPTAGLSAYVGTKSTVYWTKQSRIDVDPSGVNKNIRVWTYKDSARTNQLGYKSYIYYHSI